ncbi:hypothetical protein P8452_60429 [Trifolium repens]|jgi:hypothetical protein|nr:hypothetical protein QL285_037665 [Trifolium repens]WJX77088.1 hypothetical protein P8452_60429 [Trifolium repens]
MATTTITFIKLLSFLFVAIVVLENSHVVNSTTTTEPTIPASPGVLPYVTSPDISSFFPTPMSSSEAPFEAEASAPSPSSGEFDAKKSSSSRLEYCVVATIVAIMFSIVSF